MSKSTEIQYRDRNIAHFPVLTTLGVQNGFTWGTQENMAFSHAKLHEKREVWRRNEFFKQKCGLSYTPIAISLEPNADNTSISFIGHNELNKHLQSQADSLCRGEIEYPQPIHVEGNCVLITAKDWTITVKPGDCPCAIFCYKDPNNQLLGMLHAGRDQLDEYLPEVTFNYLINELGCDPQKLLLCITPSIAKDNYWINPRDIHLLRHIAGWEKYMEYTNGRVHLDLGNRLYDDILKSGIPEGNIHQYTVDTYEAAANGISFSHRYATVNKTSNGRFIVAAQLL